MDYDEVALEQIASAVILVDKRYRKADFTAKSKLKPNRDKLFNAYRKARLELLKEGMVCNKKDIEKIKALRKKIAVARQTQTLIEGTKALALFIVKFAV